MSENIEETTSSSSDLINHLEHIEALEARLHRERRRWRAQVGIATTVAAVLLSLDSRQAIADGSTKRKTPVMNPRTLKPLFLALMGTVFGMTTLTAAHADAFQSASSPPNYNQRITFDEFILPTTSSLTYQYESLGVTFHSELNAFISEFTGAVYDPYENFNPGYPNQNGHVISNFIPSVGSSPLVIRFNKPVKEIVLSLISQNAETTISAYLNDQLVESQVFQTSLFDSRNYYGITNSNFDTIRISVSSSDRAFIADNLQFTYIDEKPTLEIVDIAPSIAEGNTLAFSAAANDPNLPIDTLTYSLVDPPAGASIDPDTGAFNWTPTEDQGPGSFTFTVKVTDATGLSDQREITIEVAEVNQNPTLDSFDTTPQIAEGSPLAFTVTANDPDLPANQLTYSLVGAPAGASIDPDTGAFTWTPAEDQGPGSFTFTIRVEDGNGGSDERQITVNVTEVNQNPSLTVPASLSATAGAAVTFNATALDPDVPAQTLTFALVGAPSGASIDANTGAFSWVPTATGSVTFQVQVTDGQGGVDTRNVTINVTRTTYSWSGVLQPINTDGSSVFKQGSTIPVKFRLTGADAGITDLAAKLYLSQIDSVAPTSVNEATSTGAADSGNTFRYDASSGQYVFNLSTKAMAQGTWYLRVDLGDGVDHIVRIGLKK